MLYRVYEFAHGAGIHFWDIPSIMVLILMLVVGGIHTQRQRKREKDFEEELQKNREAGSISRGR